MFLLNYNSLPRLPLQGFLVNIEQKGALHTRAAKYFDRTAFVPRAAAHPWFL
jgi:hypothetical protein